MTKFEREMIAQAFDIKVSEVRALVEKMAEAGNASSEAEMTAIIQSAISEVFKSDAPAIEPAPAARMTPAGERLNDYLIESHGGAVFYRGRCTASDARFWLDQISGGNTGVVFYLAGIGSRNETSESGLLAGAMRCACGNLETAELDKLASSEDAGAMCRECAARLEAERAEAEALERARTSALEALTDTELGY